MKIPSNIDTVIEQKKSGVHDPIADPIIDKVWKRFRLVYHQVQKSVNGNIEYGNPTAGSANINGKWISVTTPAAANTDFTITHNLGRPLAGYHLLQKNGATDVYTSPTANPNPNTQFILRATGTSVAIVLFIV